MRSLLLTLLLPCVVAACGGGEQRAPASEAGRGQVDACALFPKADAERLLGGPVGEPNRGTDVHDTASGRALSHCMYMAAGSSRSASVLVRRAPGEAVPTSMEAVRAAARRAVTEQDDADFRELAEEAAKVIERSEPVPGVGQVAYWSPEMRQLTAYVAPHWMMVVSVSTDPGAGDREWAPAAELARLVAGRL
ncbi:MAG: hypothetical protein ACREMH_01160 [Gemmatimonadales bacterium]